MQISELKNFGSYEDLADLGGIKMSIKRDENGLVRALRINDAVMITTEELDILVDMARYHKSLITGVTDVMREAQDVALVAKHYYD